MTNSRMKMSGAIAAALLVGGAVSGCGNGSSSSASSGSGSYCADIKKAETDFSALGKADLSKLDQAFATLHMLANEAPAPIKADWQLLDSEITTMQTAFKDAGIKFSDLAEIQKGKIPAGVDVAKLTKLSATMSTFNDAKFKTASTNISKHAKDTCKINLTG